MDDPTVRVALERHWDASDASDFKVEHETTARMPCSIIRNRRSGSAAGITFKRAESSSQTKRFTVRRIVGGGGLWITEFVLTYDGIPSYAVSIMEFREGLVANETQYFAGRFDPAPSRSHLVERVGA